MEKIVVTGAAGFIGFHLCRKLLKDSYDVIGIDNLNDYYDINLKKARIESLNKSNENSSNIWDFYKIDIEDDFLMEKIFKDYNPDIVVHLAAQAGVRYSIKNPKPYISSNLVGFANILELCRNFEVSNLVYASSSSVYGGNSKIPFSELDSVNHQTSLYAATKKCNEILAHSYSHLYDLPATALRFFTVYGPWGRPDMAPMLFTKNILENKPIKVFNNGEMYRDFTFIDDTTEAIIRLIKYPPTKDKAFNRNNPNPSSSWARHQIYNIGNGNPISLLNFIKILEKELGKSAIKELHPMPPGDVKKTYADSEKLESKINYKPNTSLERGLKKFVAWYREYYEI